MPNLLLTNTSSMQDSSATNQTVAALKRAQESLISENIKIASASASNLGIPPSSLMSFLEKMLDRYYFFFLPLNNDIVKRVG